MKPRPCAAGGSGFRGKDVGGFHGSTGSGLVALALVIGLSACDGGARIEVSRDNEALSAQGAGWSESLPGYHRTESLPAGVAYLTFDYGPGEWTEAFLDILSAEGVAGTFFVNSVGLKRNGLRATTPPSPA